MRRPFTGASGARHALAAAALGVVALLGLVAGVAPRIGGAVQAAAPSPTSTTLPSPTSNALPPIRRDQPAAIVAGVYITGAQYAAAVQQLRTTVAHQPQQPGQPAYTDAQIRSSALTTLVDNAVMRNYARQKHIAVAASELQKAYSATAASFHTAAAFAQALKDNGLTPATFRAVLADRLLSQKVANAVAPAPSTVEEVQARHILVGSKAQADSLYKQLQHAPQQFAALAKKYSLDTGSGAKGGELGYFIRGVMVPPFEQAAFSLKPGQISHPVHSQFGYHIIQVEAHKQVPLSKADSTVQQMVLQKRSQVYSTWMTAERLRDHVKVLVSGIALGG